MLFTCAFHHVATAVERVIFCSALVERAALL